MQKRLSPWCHFNNAFAVYFHSLQHLTEAQTLCNSMLVTLLAYAGFILIDFLCSAIMLDEESLTNFPFHNHNWCGSRNWYCILTRGAKWPLSPPENIIGGSQLIDCRPPTAKRFCLVPSIFQLHLGGRGSASTYFPNVFWPLSIFPYSKKGRLKAVSGFSSRWSLDEWAWEKLVFDQWSYPIGCNRIDDRWYCKTTQSFAEQGCNITKNCI